MGSELGEPLVKVTDDGLYCPAGDFHIDPWRSVPRAVVTHAHSDHARWGCSHYLAAAPGVRLLQHRLGSDADIEGVPYGAAVDLSGVRVSFHPAGHVFGSAQVRLEHRGEVWVVTGDYKLDPDPTCEPFEPVRCHTLITESTFGLPIYRWQSNAELFGEINAWWRANAEEGKASMVFGYSLGKAQRLLAGVDPSIGPIYTHGAIENVTRVYRESGVALPETTPVGEAVGSGGRGRNKSKSWAGALIVAPPSAAGSPWARKFEPASDAFASGWMHVRGARRRRSVDRGFALSDHCDWPALLTAVKESGASRVLATHGFAAVFARHLRDQGLDADVVATRYGDEEEAEPEVAAT